jgi:fused signal recognition particle receptor
MGLLDRFTKKTGTDQASPKVQAENDPAVSQPSARTSLLGRLRQGLRRTSQILNTDIRDLFKQDGQLVDEALLDQIYALLVRTDMGAGPARQIRDEIQSEFRGRVVKLDDILRHVQVQLRELMAQQDAPLNLQSEGPTVIVVVGVNGSGKTTSIAKLAHLLIEQGHRVVLGAGDTFRAAAVEQLTVWAQRLGAEIVTGAAGSDPASVAHRTVARLIQTGADVAIIDTAGRLQTQSHLMDQLTKIRRVIEKQIPSAPHEVLLVLDATAGQNGISQARGFSDAVQCTGIVLSKLDGTAKGGVIIPIRQQFRMPVKYVGVGEKPADLAPFDPEAFVTALFAE